MYVLRNLVQVADDEASIKRNKQCEERNERIKNRQRGYMSVEMFQLLNVHKDIYEMRQAFINK